MWQEQPKWAVHAGRLVNKLCLCGVLLVSGRTNRRRHMRNAILHVLETGCQRRGFAEGLRDPPHPAATAPPRRSRCTAAV
jgi:hypothetical protein